MKSSILSLPEKLEKTIRFATAYALICILWIIDMISIGFTDFQNIKPFLTLMVIFYWSIYRPKLIPSWFVFVIGVIFDLVTGMPVGLTACLLVIIQRILIDQRLTLTGQPFTTVMFGYTSVSAIFYILQWLVFGVLNNAYIDIEYVVGRILVSIIFFPLFYLLLNLTHKILPFEKVIDKTVIGNIVVSSR